MWQEQAKAKSLSQELTENKKELASWRELQQEWQDLQEFEELGAKDEELQDQLLRFEQKLQKAEYAVFLSGAYDRGNAIVTITAGAGGNDAQDWASMLYRMYKRYCEIQGWEVKEISHSFGEASPEGRVGTKQVTFEVQGSYAYGFLKKETGVHRLVRISPFSAKALRHTSFASVEVLPVIDLKKEQDIEIKPEDVQVDTFRASGPGGQYVNKRETAIRLTHVPSGIVVSSQNQRSQQQNKDKALSLLASKLYEQKRKQQERQLSQLKGEQKAIEWGSQVRSYVLHPYQLVKDHRTGIESSQVERVLDGELQEFVEAELKAP